MNFRAFWSYISNNHISTDMAMPDLFKAKLLNQYTFLVSVCFFINAIRDLFFGFLTGFYITFTISILLFITFFFSRIRFRDYVIFGFLVLCCGIVYLFCSLKGFSHGLSLYYFAFMLAAIFLFNERKNVSYGIAIFAIITFLYFTDFSLNNKYFTFYPHTENSQFYYNLRVLTSVQVFAFIIINGYFIFLKNNLFIELHKRQLRIEQINFKLQNSLAGITSMPHIEDLVKLAMSNDISFLPLYKQIFPNFYKNLLEINPAMTNDEFKFCALLKLGFTTKDISASNHLAIRTVQTRKNRLRKSFHISSDEDLYVWVNKFC